MAAAGQMHGLVILDENDEVIRPCILWNDGRTAEETEWLNNAVGKERLSELTANIAFAGFTAPKLLWLKKNEPENFKRIAKIMLPKDYITYKLTGVHSCDYSDASGMLLLDVKNRRWSPEMLEICGVREEQLPALYESFAPVGELKADIAKEFGLSESVVVAAGAGDNAAAAVGTGTVGNGACNISIGTSGTIFITHYNLLVNCGFELNGILVDANINGSTITIDEHDNPNGPQANCMCSIDNSFRIENIPHGTYTLVFKNWYPAPNSLTYTF